MAICDAQYIYAHTHVHKHFCQFIFIILIPHAKAGYAGEGRNRGRGATGFRNGKFSLWQQRVGTILGSEEWGMHLESADWYLPQEASPQGQKSTITVCGHSK